jgi:hypothetical protein
VLAFVLGLPQNCSNQGSPRANVKVKVKSNVYFPELSSSDFFVAGLNSVDHALLELPSQL